MPTSARLALTPLVHRSRINGNQSVTVAGRFVGEISGEEGK